MDVIPACWLDFTSFRMTKRFEYTPLVRWGLCRVCGAQPTDGQEAGRSNEQAGNFLNNSILLHHFGVPAGTEFWSAALRGIIDIHDAEAARVTVLPFEVVHERP